MNNPLSPYFAITTGDHFGIGPEVIAKGLSRLGKDFSLDSFLIFGDPKLYLPFRKLLPRNWSVISEPEFIKRTWRGPKRGALNFVVPTLRRSVKAGSKDKANYFCGRYIELAVGGALAGKVAGIITGPIEKNALRDGGFPYDGHTEMLKSLCKAKSVTMMMAGPRLRTTLVTGHLAIRDVPKAVTRNAIRICLDNTINALRYDFGIKSPRIAVMGLNPHCGDGGLFGNEEDRIIIPAIRASERLNTHAKISGPFSADGFFSHWEKRHRRNFDAVVCMYHDQGLIPAKFHDFESTVNVTLGLPIIRTSVDHGVGYDIVGKNRADSSSFCAAVQLAVRIGKNRRRMLQG